MRYYTSMPKIISHSLEETQKIAHDWLIEIVAKMANYDKATIVGLSGHLGAGKTAFVKAVAKELGIKEVVTSPTFVLMKIYGVEVGPLQHKKLIHIDAYRLERSEDLAALEFDKLATDKNNLIMVEWPEKVGIDKREGVEKLKFENLTGRDGLAGAGYSVEFE